MKTQYWPVCAVGLAIIFIVMVFFSSSEPQLMDSGSTDEEVIGLADVEIPQRPARKEYNGHESAVELLREGTILRCRKDVTFDTDRKVMISDSRKVLGWLHLWGKNTGREILGSDVDLEVVGIYEQPFQIANWETRGLPYEYVVWARTPMSRWVFIIVSAGTDMRLKVDGGYTGVGVHAPTLGEMSELFEVMKVSEGVRLQ